MLEDLNNKQAQCKSRAEFNYVQELLFKNGFKWRNGETSVLDYYSEGRDTFIQIKNGELNYNTGIKNIAYDEIDYDFLIDILSDSINQEISKNLYDYLNQIRTVRGLSMLRDENFIENINLHLNQVESEETKKAIANWLFCGGEWVFKVKSTYYLYNNDSGLYFTFDVFDAPSSTYDESMKHVFYGRDEAEIFESKYWEVREEY